MELPFQLLDRWGWDPRWNALFEEAAPQAPRGLTLVPGRVIGREGPLHLVETPGGPRLASVSGRWQFTALEAELPVVGDWALVQVVDADQAVLHGVLARRTTLSRAVSDGAKSPAGRESLLAANLDVLGIVTGLDGNFNPRRAQRLATLARHGGVTPLWILSKADLGEAPGRVVQARLAAGSDPVVAVSALTGEGVEALEPWLGPGQTVALVGSSGVGKTTLTNRLLGSDEALTGAVRAADSKGRHTTTSRHLYRLPSGALLMDTPGVRTVGLWADEDDLAAGFADIEALAASCRFHDCRHQGEPGCAVAEALADGRLEAARWDGWRRQERELRHLALKEDKGLQRAERERWKSIAQFQRTLAKDRGRAP